MEYLLYGLLWLVGIIATPFAVFLAGKYIIFLLAKANILWTTVEQGWCKIVLKYGKYSKIINPGLRWLGLPGINSLYARKMKFLKSVIKEDGTIAVEIHKDEKITSFKTTKYPYALPFKDEEDCRGLPLSGVLTINGSMADGFKMFFVASDWYATIVLLALSCFRDIITTISYEEITGQYSNQKAATNVVREKIAELLWKKMNSPREGDKLSVVDELLEIYGFEVDSVELASIDPPAEWRAITLAPYKAQKEKEAAEEQAKASAALFGDTNLALKDWIIDHPDATQGQIENRQAELAQRAYLKAGGQYQRIEGLENAQYVGFGGGRGGMGFLAGGKQGGSRKSKSGERGSANDDPKGLLKKSPTELSAEDLAERDEIVRKRGQKNKGKWRQEDDEEE